MAEETQTGIVKLSEIPLTNGVLTPSNFAGVFRLGQLFFETGMVPEGVKTPEQAAIVVAAGLEIGLSPLQSIQNIMIIGNKPSVWGDAALALVSTHKNFQDCDETNDGSEATCTVIREGRKPVVRSFSMADAKTAGLIGKPIWQKYPKRMLQMRARAYALRDAFPDALKGIAIREEVEDYGEDTPPVSRKESAKSVLEKATKPKVEQVKKPEPEKPAEQPKVIDAEVVDPPAKDDVPEKQVNADVADVVGAEGNEDDGSSAPSEPDAPTPAPAADAGPKTPMRQMKEWAMGEPCSYAEEDAKAAIVGFLAAHETEWKALDDPAVFEVKFKLLQRKNKTQMNAFLKKGKEIRAAKT